MATPSAKPHDSDDGETAYLEARLPQTADAPREARAAVARLCDAGALPPSVRPDLLLLVSEVVTIAVVDERRSRGAPLVLTAARRNGVVRVTLADSGHGFTVEARARAEGYGLYLLDHVATSWGVEKVAEGDDGTRVWFELTTNRDSYSHARQHRLAI
jgi:signal transduction histidine kinase